MVQVLPITTDSHDDQRPDGFVYVIPMSGPTPTLEEIFRRNSLRLGRATGQKALILNPGNPRETDPDYESLRDAELERSDEAHARAYDKQVQLVTPEFLQRVAADAVQRRFGLEDNHTPSIIMVTGPACSEPAILKVFPDWIASDFGAQKFLETFKEFFESVDLRKLASQCKTNREFLRSLDARTNGYMRGKLGGGNGKARLLFLEPFENGKNPKIIARLAGEGPYQGVSRELGACQAFFLDLFFNSDVARRIDNVTFTIVPEKQAIEHLMWCKGQQHLKLSGRDLGKPEYRVRKMWTEFVSDMEHDESLTRLFGKWDLAGQKAYAIALAPEETFVRKPCALSVLNARLMQIGPSATD